MATTRLQMFKDIAIELGDFIQLVATAGSTTTQFNATEDMVWADSSLNGRESYYAVAAVGSVANAGKRRIVWSTDEDTQSITVNPAWPATPTVGDVLYLVNSRGTGVTVPEIFDKIHQLTRRVGTQLAQEVAGTPALFDYTAPIIPIPSSWRYFLGAQVEMGVSGSLDWQPLLAAPLMVQKWDRTVTIQPNYRSIVHGKRVRLIGAEELTPMELDTDSIWVPSSWLSKLAAAELMESAATRSGEVTLAYTFGEIIKAQSTQLEGRIKKRWSAMGQRVDLEQ